MTKTQQTALTVGAVALGAAIVARTRRAARAIDLDGKSVVITGGSRGLGLLLAREFGSQGARLVIAARDGEELGRAAEDLMVRGIKATTIVCDVTEREQAERLVAHAQQELGSVDVLINNAGVITVGPLDHMSHADF